MKGSIDYLNALVLGLLQGLSEFLPISSTAHLRLWGAFTEQKDPGRGLFGRHSVRKLVCPAFLFSQRPV